MFIEFPIFLKKNETVDVDYEDMGISAPGEEKPEPVLVNVDLISFVHKFIDADEEGGEETKLTMNDMAELVVDMPYAEVVKILRNWSK